MLNTSSIDLEEIQSEEDDYNSSPPDFDISTYPADFTLEGLDAKLKSNEIVVPDFQRQFVWSQEQASKLVESFLVGLPVPAIFLYSEYKTQNFLLIDGQQRLKSLSYFFDGYFGKEIKGKKPIFRLTGLSEKSRWYNKTFNEMEDADKKKLKNRVLRAFIIQQLDPADDTSIYHVFERLNTGGTLLNNQEIRNCVYFGTFNDLLKNELNLNKDWRLILGRNKPDHRMKDLELILRLFSLTDINKYQKPLKDHMSKYMKRNRDISPKELIDISSKFNKTCHSVLQSLGEKPFHVKKGLNSAIFDCVMASFYNNQKKIPKDISQRYKKLVNELEKEKLITSSTTNDEIVKKRFKVANQILFA